MAILVTGGAGFIGSHTCVELLNAGYDVVIADNLYNASEKAVDRVKQITGKDLKFYKADIRDKEAMNEIFEKEEIESVIHFAGLKAVGESVVKPLEYYENNIAGTLVLCDVMRNHGVKNIIFSSSATVYGDPAFIPITEECPKGTCTNPYGWTKWMLEQNAVKTVLDPETMSAREIWDAVKDGDTFACEVAERFGKYLGLALSAVAGTADPEVFVIGGGMSRAGQIVIDYIQKYYVKYVFRGCRDAEFILASLGNDAGMYGAAKLVIEE